MINKLFVQYWTNSSIKCRHYKTQVEKFKAKFPGAKQAPRTDSEKLYGHIYYGAVHGLDTSRTTMNDA